MKRISATRLRQLLTYDPVSGVFTWHARRGVNVGDVAGTIDKLTGYRFIGVDGHRDGASRLAWLYMTGAWPNGQIDHKNGIRTDDRFENLRDVPRFMNQQNQRRPQKNNTTGFLGVSPSRGRFMARIRIGGRLRNLGRFDTAALAHAVYVAAKRVNHEGCTL